MYVYICDLNFWGYIVAYNISKGIVNAYACMHILHDANTYAYVLFYLFAIQLSSSVTVMKEHVRSIKSLISLALTITYSVLCPENQWSYIAKVYIKLYTDTVYMYALFTR